jgi:hypothetical protein
MHHRLNHRFDRELHQPTRFQRIPNTERADDRLLAFHGTCQGGRVGWQAAREDPDVIPKTTQAVGIPRQYRDAVALRKRALHNLQTRSPGGAKHEQFGLRHDSPSLGCLTKWSSAAT